MNNEKCFKEEHYSKSEFKKSKSITDQQQIFIFCQKDNRNHKKYQTNTSKLRDNI